MNVKSAKKARIGAMQIMYQMDLTEDYSLDNLDIFLKNFAEDTEYEDKEIVFTEEEEEYLGEIIPVIIEKLGDIDQIINKNLEGWTIERLSKVDKSILRISVYEMMYRDDIPGPVSINEAVEIAKNYASENSPKFINGILGSIFKEI